VDLRLGLLLSVRQKRKQRGRETSGNKPGKGGKKKSGRTRGGETGTHKWATPVYELRGRGGFCHKNKKRENSGRRKRAGGKGRHVYVRKGQIIVKKTRKKGTKVREKKSKCSGG